MRSLADARDPIASPGHDPALVPYLQALDAAEADRLLAELFCNRVHRTIRDVVARALGAYAPGAAWVGEDVEDVASEAVARVLGRLRGLKAHDSRDPIQNFDAYAARVAANVCHDHFRRRRPERARLRNQVWYVLTRDPALRLERGTSGNWICRLARPGGDRVANSPRRGAPDSRALPALIHSTLAGIDRAIELSELVDLMAQALGMHDASRAAPVAPNTAATSLESLADPTACPPLTALENAQYLKRLWAEVQALSLRQRTVLLLNLRDAGGGDALDLLPLTGTASLGDIAGTLALECEELARLWPDLPLEDADIAARLGVSRQQVINLRKAARARLGRRMASVDGTQA